MCKGYSLYPAFVPGSSEEAFGFFWSFLCLAANNLLQLKLFLIPYSFLEEAFVQMSVQQQRVPGFSLSLLILLKLPSKFLMAAISFRNKREKWAALFAAVLTQGRARSH